MSATITPSSPTTITACGALRRAQPRPAPSRPPSASPLGAPGRRSGPPGPSRPGPSRPGPQRSAASRSDPRPEAQGHTARRTRPAGQVEPAQPLAGAQRLPRWDRMRFQPAMPCLPTTYLEDETVSRTSIEQAPDPVRTCRLVLTAAAEVLAGRRRVDQMARWTSPELFDALARRAGLARRILGDLPGPVCAVRSVHAQLTLTGACEATATLVDGERLRAAALRLELQRGRWVLVALEIS